MKGVYLELPCTQLFQKKPFIYVYYSHPISILSKWKYNHVSRLSQFEFTSLDEINPKSEKVLLEVKQEKASHNGGCLVFGPDKHLYLSLGDGGKIFTL